LYRRPQVARVEAIFDSLYPEYKGELAKVMVSDDPRVYGKGGLLDQFTRNDMPRVAISVDMLDTGIDIREVVNLVFAKPVFSYTKFWQMIGRGTRLLEPNKIKPWCPVKDVFQIIDCWDNFDYFKLTPKGKEPKAQIPLPVRFAGVRIEKIEAAQALGLTSIAEKRLQHFANRLLHFQHGPSRLWRLKHIVPMGAGMCSQHFLQRMVKSQYCVSGD
jgi:type I restriction enzyme R subunit